MSQEPEEPPKQESPQPTTEASDSDSDLEFEDVGTDTVELNGTPEADVPQTDNNDDDSDSFDDLEDVDIDAMFSDNPQPEQETLNITINQQPGEEDGKRKSRRRKAIVVPKEERLRRKLVHQLYLMTMTCHGVVRNKWCNDYLLQVSLKTNIPEEIQEIFEKNNRSSAKEELDYVKLRRFIEGMRRMSAWWGKRFRVMAQGLVRKDWADLLVKQEATCGTVNLERFRSLISTHRGSRDLGAQGFVALARSIGVNARLVFSLQPPDFKSITAAPKPEDKKEETPIEEKHPEPKSEFDPVFIPDPKAELLRKSRNRPSSPSKPGRGTLRNKYTFPVSSYPVFWCEVWNPYTKKWITVDPIVNNVVEVMPSRRKCKFEAPASDHTHQTLYVLAYDRYGGVKDVTRRYTQYYNARTSKRRIESVSEKDEHWYGQMLKGARSKYTQGRYNEADILESKEFHNRDISEGVPNNMTDFKNHPVYALESQLRQDEVIYPKNESSKCGTFRPMNKNTVVPVYKRSHVFQLRSAKAWYLRGRVLKVGAQPLKTKEKQASQIEDDDDDGKVRLYAEFQTELYRAPRIEDGQITKNAYGNVEIFTPTMMPENGHLVKVLELLTIKLLERAARDILRIDYARAIVAFDFGDTGGKKNRNRTPSAKVGGILIDVQYKEAMDLIVENLLEIEREEQRKKVELTALRAWSFFLKKLVITDRLNRQHGQLEDERMPEVTSTKIKEEPEDDDEEEGYYSVNSDDDSGGEDEYVVHETREERARKRAQEVKEEEDEHVGIKDEDEEMEEGGFLLSPREPSVEQDNFDIPMRQANEEPSTAEDNFDGGGGFFVEDTTIPENEAAESANAASDNEESSEEEEENASQQENKTTPEVHEDSIPTKPARLQRNTPEIKEFTPLDSQEESLQSPEQSAEELQRIQDEEDELGFEYSDSD